MRHIKINKFKFNNIAETSYRKTRVINQHHLRIRLWDITTKLYNYFLVNYHSWTVSQPQD